jgi:hypothetical protein
MCQSSTTKSFALVKQLTAFAKWIIINAFWLAFEWNRIRFWFCMIAQTLVNISATFAVIRLLPMTQCNQLQPQLQNYRFVWCQSQPLHCIHQQTILKLLCICSALIERWAYERFTDYNYIVLPTIDILPPIASPPTTTMEWGGKQWPPLSSWLVVVMLWLIVNAVDGCASAECSASSVILNWLKTAFECYSSANIDLWIMQTLFCFNRSIASHLS